MSNVTDKKVTHKDWQFYIQSMSLVESTYRLTKEFPTEEKFGLCQQMRRAAVRIPSNIAEGAARESEKELLRFLYIALGSLAELETQYTLAERLGFLHSKTRAEIDDAMTSIRKAMMGYMRKLKEKCTGTEVF